MKIKRNQKKRSIKRSKCGKYHLSTYNLIILVVLLFLLGWFSNTLISGFINFNVEKPFTYYPAANQERFSPQDWVKEDHIHVYNDTVIIDQQGVEWASFTDTNSMDPLIDSNTNALEIVPKSPDQLKEGDIISYESEYATGTIIHRIVEIGSDDQGWYCRTKGDNNNDVDPGNIRFSQIKRVLIGIIY
jgi:hypothetical protein